MGVHAGEIVGAVAVIATELGAVATGLFVLAAATGMAVTVGVTAFEAVVTLVVATRDGREHHQEKEYRGKVAHRPSVHGAATLGTEQLWNRTGILQLR